MTHKASSPAGKTVPAERPSPGPVNILVVDDRPENLLAFETILGELGQNVVCVGSGAEALRELLNRKFAVILLDVRMATMDGYETAELIRQRPASQYTPIIFVTAGGPGETHVSRGYALGAVDYLFSPVDPAVMRAKVSVFIELARKAAIINEQAELLREAAERRAEQVETRMQSLLNRLQVGVWRATPDGTITDANPAFLRLLRLESIHDPAIRNVKEAVTGIPLQRLLGSQGSLDTTSPPSDHELEHPDGSRVWVGLSKTVVAPEPDQLCVDGVLADISDRKAHERLIQESNRALQRSNEDLNQFAYAASQQLQDPLKTVAERAGALQRQLGKGDAKGQEALGVVIDQSKQMERSLAELVLYAHIGQSSNEIAASLVAADRALDQALQNLRGEIEASGAKITRGALPTVRMQESHLVRLFEKLVGNAIRWHGADAPAIHVGSDRLDGTWRFSVRDNGVGIAPEHREQVFGVFKRTGSPGRPSVSGIGLAICAKIVERYGGRIWVESEVGCGSTFYFTAR